MISPELISRYPFFADLELQQLMTLANVAEGITAETGEYLFHEGEEIKFFYVVIEGAIGIIRETIKGDQKTDSVISAVGPGHVFAWSALVPPYKATASVKALTPCWLIAFDRKKLLKAFQDDCQFGYRMMEKIAQISRDRLLDARIESLVFMA
jgi:CRP/FNR family cyclic AMP-dependent transcriptional regulator